MKVYKYRIWCITENQYVYVWRDETQGLPIACPNNSADSIDASSIVIVEVLGEVLQVKFVDTDILDFAKAVLQERGFNISVEQGVDQVEYRFTFPFDVDILGADFIADYPNANRLDSYDIHFIPANDLAIGVVTADSLAGSTTIAVSSTVFNYIGLDFVLQIDNNEYTIAGIDRINNSVTLSTGLVSNVAINTPIYLRIPIVRDKAIYVNKKNTVGEWSDGAKNIRANTIIRVRIKFANMTASAFTIPFTLYYKYSVSEI